MAIFNQASMKTAVIIPASYKQGVKTSVVFVIKCDSFFFFKYVNLIALQASTK